MDEKKRKKWDDHIAACKAWLRHEHNIPEEKIRFKYHWESEIAVDDYLRELENEVGDLRAAATVLQDAVEWALDGELPVKGSQSPYDAFIDFKDELRRRAGIKPKDGK